MSSLATNNDAPFALYLTSTVEVPFLLFPALHIYREGADRSRVCLDHQPQYDSLKHTVRTVFSHIVGSYIARLTMLAILTRMSQVPETKAALIARLGEDRALTVDDIATYLLHHTPTIVLKDLEEEGSDIVWGQVLKGSDQGAGSNEIYLRNELAVALCDISPSPSMTPAEKSEQHSFHRLVTSITLLHKTMHSLVKHLFTPAFTTPLLGGFVGDGYGNGESGRTFERNYLVYHLEVSWSLLDFQKSDRMWRICHVLAGLWPSSPLILDNKNVIQTLESFQRSALWIPPLNDLQEYLYNTNSHVKLRLGVSAQMMKEEEEEEGVVDMSNMVFAHTCARGVGRPNRK
ncbi:hypothetical protein C8J57DRAFT_1316674 [Mycena rebaudengoi]|nr:hypothetical protein C8J57DRAFT_1316674 [Mycena rebaudengoi]